jgi:hypothetical protein
MTITYAIRWAGVNSSLLSRLPGHLSTDPAPVSVNMNSKAFLWSFVFPTFQSATRHRGVQAGRANAFSFDEMSGFNSFRVQMSQCS